MISVVLLRPQNAENLGFISRAMANFDFENLVLVSPTCSNLSDQAMRTAMHSKSILKKAKIRKRIPKYDLVVGTTSALGTDYNIPRVPMTAEEFAKKYDNNQNVALVFGNEGTGLTNKELKLCDFVINIPTSKNYPAMNLSHAVSTVLYEIYKKHGKNKIGENLKKATKIEKQIILRLLNELIENTEFSTKEKKETQKIVWKKIIEKSMLSKREAFAVLGFLRKLNRT